MGRLNKSIINFIKYYKCLILFKITGARFHLNLVTFFLVLSFVSLGFLSASFRRSVRMLQFVVGLLLSVLLLPHQLRCH